MVFTTHKNTSFNPYMQIMMNTLFDNAVYRQQKGAAK